MIELLVAYLFWEGNAPAEWWGIYAVVIIIRFYGIWRRNVEIERANAEADAVVKKLFEGKL